MSSEHGPAQPLEQRCVRPGHWVIEGYDVQRFTGRRARSWHTEWHAAWSPGEEPHVERTLDGAREWIREQLNK